jgi:hypothetical protein
MMDGPFCFLKTLLSTVLKKTKRIVRLIDVQKPATTSLRVKRSNRLFSLRVRGREMGGTKSSNRWI